MEDRRKLPEGWALCPIEDIARINPRHSGQLNPSLEVSFVSMAGISEKGWHFNSSEVRALSSVRNNFTHFAEGDVLFAKITPCMENGKAAIAYGLRNGLGCGTTELHVVRPIGGVGPKYLYYFLRQESVRKDAALNMTGTAGQLRVPVGYIRSAILRLAPLNEQHRIAVKLEELLAKVDKCIERLERIPAILKRFRNAILSAAATGQLTSSLRKSDDITGSWQQVKLGNAADLIQIGPFGSLLHKSEYVKDQIPLVNPTNIVAGRIIPSPDTTISPAKKHQLRRYALQEGDVVIGRRGEMGRCAVVTKKEDGWVCGTGSLFVRPHAKLLPSFLHILISSPAAIAYLEESNVGSTMANLNQGIFHQMEIPLPDVEEQQEIVHRVEALFKIADQIEARYKKAKAVVDKLTQSILAKAFRGELVPQDPNDEPASELLNRIREERARRQETSGNGQNNRAGNRGRRKGKA